MFCNNCGRPLTGREKFCPGCGNPLPVNESGPRKKKRQKKTFILVLALLLSGGAAGFLSWYFLAGGGHVRSSAEAGERYQMASQISERVDEIIAPWLNENGMLEYDTARLEEAAAAVYDYALELVDNGEIADAAYCGEGASVSFFLHDGSTSVYLPPIQDAWSGGGEQGIITVNLTSGLENAGHENAGETISRSVSGFQSYDYDGDLTAAELQDILGSLDEDQIRALFWRGHGGIYTEKNGEVVAALVLDEKMTPEKEALYAEDRQKPDDGGPPLLNVSGGNTYAVNYRFFDKYTTQVEGGLFFTGACYSGADGGRLAQTLLDKGFDAYVGASDAINILYSNEVLSAAARNLTQMQNGCYTEIADALDQAVTAYEDSFGENVNFWGGRFVMGQQAPFRLVDPYLDVTLDWEEGALDTDQLSIHVMQVLEDGTTKPYSRRVGGSELDGGSFSIADVDPGGTYQIDINYGSWLLKTVTLELSDLTFENNAAYTEIALDAADLDIIPEDSGGTFLSDASVEVWAADDENGINGHIQEPVLSKNDAGEEVYRITLAPGTYTVRVTADGEEIQQTVTVKEDMVLRLTPGQNSSAGYGDIVSQYEEKYGELQFYEQTYGTNYTGVFLLRLVDFDQDGTDELVIGYAVPYPQGIEYCAWPALDVWTMENGTPVCVYEGAYVQQSDIGRHCLYTEWNGNFYLVTGWSGSNVELNLLKLENGTFVTDTTLKSAEIMSGAYVTGMEYYLNDEAVDENAFNSYHEQIYASGSFGGSLYEGDSTTLEDLSAELQETKKQMGIG